MSKISITLPSLESCNHIVGDIERGVKIYNRGGVQFDEREPNYYWAKVPHKGNDTKMVSLTFAPDGQEIEQHYCDCIRSYSKNPPICRHVVAAVLAIQGGIVQTGISLGLNESVNTTVVEQNTARAVGSGSLDVFATPMMVALMERAACEALSGAVGEGQTSVGTSIDVKHTAASPIGSNITATATVVSVRGRTIGFEVTARDEKGEIGRGKHTRVIVEVEQFIAKTKARKQMLR